MVASHAFVVLCQVDIGSQCYMQAKVLDPSRITVEVLLGPHCFSVDFIAS